MLRLIMSEELAGVPIPARGQWLLEGGDDPWNEVVGAISHCLDEVIAGGVLEVISWSPGIELDVARWCADAGHQLLRMVSEGPCTRFWIRKIEEMDNGTTVEACE